MAEVPNDRTTKRNKFMQRVSETALCVCVVLCYAVVFAFDDRLLAATRWLSGFTSIFDARIEFLQAIDERSVASFTGTVLVGLFFVPSMMILDAILCWKAGGMPEKIIRFDLSLISAILKCWVILSVPLWICFIDAPHGVRGGRLGMAGVFLWPVFPGLGAVVIWMTELCIFWPLLALVRATFGLGNR